MPAIKEESQVRDDVVERNRLLGPERAQQQTNRRGQ